MTIQEDGFELLSLKYGCVCVLLGMGTGISNCSIVFCKYINSRFFFAIVTRTKYISAIFVMFCGNKL